MKINDIVNQYIGLRNAIASKKKEFDQFKKDNEEVMRALEMQILEVSKSTGVDSFKTEFGTAFRTTKTYAKLFDADARIKYALESGDFGLFTSHVNKLHTIELLNEGVDPSSLGVDYESEEVIQFRKN